MLVGQRLVVVDVYPKIARARVGLRARRVVRTEAPAVGAPAATASAYGFTGRRARASVNTTSRMQAFLM
jgi:hypothetical protein